MTETHNTIDMYVCENEKGCTDVGTIQLHGFTLIADVDLALLREAATLLRAARGQYMRYDSDDLDVYQLTDQMQGILAGDVCSETLEGLEGYTS